MKERAPGPERPVTASARCICPVAGDDPGVKLDIGLLRVVIERYIENTPFFSRPKTENWFQLGMGAPD